MGTATVSERAVPKVGGYLHDGTALYRVEVASPDRSIVILENCGSFVVLDGEVCYRRKSMTFQEFREAQFEKVGNDS
jgi:hypothetical protein